MILFLGITAACIATLLLIKSINGNTQHYIGSIPLPLLRLLCRGQKRLDA